jgi:hypothetical protein
MSTQILRMILSTEVSVPVELVCAAMPIHAYVPLALQTLPLRGFYGGSII